MANDKAASLIQSYWAAFNNPGKPDKITGPSRPVIRQVPMSFNSWTTMPLGVEPDGNDPTGIDYKTLRQFADEHEMTRTVIETCKDQLCKLRWTWRRIPKPGESTIEVKAKSDSDVRVQALNDFFEMPDKEFGFEQWFRMVLEELLVCDVVAIYQEKTILDQPYAYRLLDTATIKRCVDSRGVTPSPLLPYPENIAYQQIILGKVVAEFTTDEMLYYTRNPRVWAFYGYSPVEQILMTITTGMRRMAMQLMHYTDGNVPAMFLRAPKEWTLTQIKEFQEYWNQLLAGNLGELAKGWMIPGELDPVFPQKEVLKDEFDEWVARVVCYAFSVSPTPFIRNLNRSTSEQSREQADEEGLQSRMRTATLIMGRLQNMSFNFRGVEFHLIVDRPQDSLKQADIDDKDIRNGIKSIDEVRRERGFPEIGAPNRVYTANGFIPLIPDDKAIGQLIPPPAAAPQNGTPQNMMNSTPPIMNGSNQNA